jgi:O-antigen/teichoic acid export membrane protein
MALEPDTGMRDLREWVGAALRPFVASQLRRNMTSSLVLMGLNFLVTAASYPIYLHYLGYEKYGLWLVLTAVLGSAQLGNLGVNAAVSRFVAHHHGRRDYAAIERDVTTAHIVLALSGAVVIAIILGFQTRIVGAFKLAPANAALVLRLLPAVSVLSLYVFIVRATAATLSGLGRMDLANYGRIGSRVLGVVVAAVLLFMGLSVESLVVSYFTSEMAAHVFYLVVISQRVRIRYLRLRAVNMDSVRRLLAFGSGLMGGSLLDMVLGPFNKVMLSRWAGVEAIPVYEIAYNAAMYFRGLVTAAFQALMPEVSRLSGVAEAGRQRIREIYWRAMRMTFALGTPMFVVVFAAAAFLLKIWLRREFDPQLPGAFRVMLLAAYCSLVGATPYYFLMGLGRAEAVFVAALIQTGLDVLAVLAFPLVGIAVTASHVAGALLIGTAVSTAYVLWHYGRAMRAAAEPAPAPVEAMDAEP